MKRLALTLIACLLSVNVFSETNTAEKPVQHIIIEDIASFAEAKKVFIETTNDLKAKTVLDENELHQIHMITYSLEKSIAFYAENLNGKAQKLAEDMAVVVEDIHLASENNRQESTEEPLSNYLKLAEDFISSIE
tara:strand:+ start:542 stop:946 length:405 start_codon:yes stop_codon:yes gene_type:complete